MKTRIYKGKVPFPTTTLNKVGQIDNQVFEATFRYAGSTKDKKHPERVRHMLTPTDGPYAWHSFTMLPQEFKEIQTFVGNVQSFVINGCWTFIKRGSAFGLRFHKLRDVKGHTAKNIDLLNAEDVTTAAQAPTPSPSQLPLPVVVGGISLAPVWGHLATEATASGIPTGATAAPAPTPPAPEVQIKRTRVAICVDASGSMSSIGSTAVVAGVNTTLDGLRKNATDENIFEASVFLFGVGHNSDVVMIEPMRDIRSMPNMTPERYSAQGMTPLFECVGKAIDYIKQMPVNSKENTAALVYIITDGAENASRPPYTVQQVTAMMAKEQATDAWTFAFQIPDNDIMTFRRTYPGVPEGNIQGWAVSQGARGYQAASVLNAQSVASYSASRSVGTKSSRNFYTTNLAGVDLNALRSQLTDYSGLVKFWKVEKEADISAFAAEKTKAPYVVGTIFYMLTKKETVQSYKDILVRVKHSKQVYGGQNARKLIGIDPNDKNDATVIPGNHADYDIFVQSASVNRKLVRGTEIIYLPLQKPVKETWDSAAAVAAAEAKKQQQSQNK